MKNYLGLLISLAVLWSCNQKPTDDYLIQNGRLIDGHENRAIELSTHLMDVPETYGQAGLTKTNDVAAKRNKVDSPIGFKFYNEQEEAVIFLTEDIDQRMTLEISNTSNTVTTLKKLTGKISARNHHFELVFRPGTISSSAIQVENSADYELFISLDSKGNFEYNNDGTYSLYFKAKSAFTMQAGEKIKIRLLNIRGDQREGARGTRVMLKYQNLLHAGARNPFSGNTQSSLSLKNIGGRN